jgi:hypothetical protein
MEYQRRATDRRGASARDKFLRFNARAATVLGVLQLAVNILGRIVEWGLETMVVLQGREPLDLPAPPWSLVAAVFGFAVLTLLGYALWHQQLDQPSSRAMDLVLGWRPWGKAQGDNPKQGGDG